jgi:hypothetical protein
MAPIEQQMMQRPMNQIPVQNSAPAPQNRMPMQNNMPPQSSGSKKWMIIVLIVLLLFGFLAYWILAP